MTEHKLLSPCPFCGEKLFLDIDEGGGVAILHSLKEKDCFFPSILEIEMPVGTTLEQMIEKINRRPIQESFEHAIVGASLVSAARIQGNVSDVSMTRDVSTDIKTPSSIENTNPDYYKQELASRDALIERLIEAGNVLVDQNDMDNGAVMAAEDEWRFLVTEWKAMKGGE